MKELSKKELLRPDEVAELWRVSKSTVYRWVDLGIIKTVRKGGVVRITREEAEKINSESG